MKTLERKGSKLWDEMKKTAEEPFARHLVRRLAQEEGISISEARARFLGCLQFLWACVTSPERSQSPSEPVDTAWHCFLLYSEDYAAFCERFAGKFIHHRPSRSRRVSEVNYLFTRDFLVRTIGVDESIWPRSAGEKCEKTGSGCGND